MTAHAARTPKFIVSRRQLGGFSIIDRFGKCRMTVPTRQDADKWIATQEATKRATRQAQEVS